MITNEYDQVEIALKPHAKIIPEKEWKINLNLNDILKNEFVQEFINNEMLQFEKTAIPTTRKYTEKELNRILADCHKQSKASNRHSDFNTIIDNEWTKWAKSNCPGMKIPNSDINRIEREAQLIQMGIPQVDDTRYHRDPSKFLTATMNDIMNLNDAIGNPVNEYIKMTFVPVAIYTDYVGNLASLTDEILQLGCDNVQEHGHYYESEHLKYNNYCASYCTFHKNACDYSALQYMLLKLMFEDTSSLKNHLSIIFKNEISRYMNYDQLSYNSPITSSVKYIRYTLLLG